LQLIIDNDNNCHYRERTAADITNRQKEGAMYVRIVRPQLRPGQVDELAKRWEAFIAPRLREAPGFQHAYFSGNREQNTIAGVTVWDQRPPEVMQQAMQEFQAQVQDIMTGPPTIEDYEVLVEV
jgi:quinol monooxygenase YgiN